MAIFQKTSMKTKNQREAKNPKPQSVQYSSNYNTFHIRSCDGMIVFVMISWVGVQLRGICPIRAMTR